MKKIIKNIPNAITITRLISCVAGAFLLVSGNIIPAVSCYAYGAISDAIDGFLARKLNAVSEFGKKLDPISDKLYALSLIVPAIILGNYLMVLPLLFEGIISGINIYSDVKYKLTHTEKIGKLKTIMLFPTMILGLLVTLQPYLYVAFVPLLYVSLKLQARSIEAYFNQFDELKKLNKKDSEFDNKKINLKNRKQEKEINNNVNNIKKSTSNKTKKLIRKKD